LNLLRARTALIFNEDGTVTIKITVLSAAYYEKLSEFQIDCKLGEGFELLHHSKLIAVDFADEKQINDAVNIIIAEFGTLDILINNFSIFNFKSALNTTPEMFHNVMKNVFAAFEAKSIHVNLAISSMVASQ